jgi:hypothetical protein
MAGRKQVDITDITLSGFNYFEKLRPLFVRLHDVGCVWPAPIFCTRGYESSGWVTLCGRT